MWSVAPLDTAACQSHVTAEAQRDGGRFLLLQSLNRSFHQRDLLCYA